MPRYRTTVGYAYQDMWPVVLYHTAASAAPAQASSNTRALKTGTKPVAGSSAGRSFYLAEKTFLR